MGEVRLAGAAELGVGQFVEQDMGLAVEDPMALLDDGGADRLRQVTLSGPGPAEEEPVLPLGDEVPPLVGLLASGERALAVAPLFALAEVPLAALAFWALGAWIPFDYWMRRLCFRAGLVGLVM